MGDCPSLLIAVVCPATLVILSPVLRPSSGTFGDALAVCSGTVSSYPLVSGVAFLSIFDK